MTGSIPWTCCQCGNTFDYDEGDVDERMCFECLNEEDNENKTSMQRAADAEDPKLDIKYIEDKVDVYIQNCIKERRFYDRKK